MLFFIVRLFLVNYSMLFTLLGMVTEVRLEQICLHLMMLSAKIVIISQTAKEKMDFFYW